MHFYIPANLDIDKVLQERPPTAIKKCNVTYLIYIIHLITWIPAANKGLVIRNGYVPINSTLLQRRIRNYRSYIDYLLVNKIIQTDNQYIKGKKSKGYRLAWQYCQGIKKVTVGDESLLPSEKNENQLRPSIKRKYNHLLKWYNSDLQINYALAMEYIEADLHRKLSAPVLQRLRAKPQELRNPRRQYQSATVNIEKIAAAHFSPFIDDNVCRLHSVLSNLYSPLRNCLTYNGLDLVSIDIKNCQPYLSTVLLNPLFWSDDNKHCALLTVNDVFSSCKRDVFKSSSSLSSFIMLCKNDKTRTGSDLHKYIELVKDGVFYEYIEHEILKGTVKCDNERKKVKAAVFQVLFTDNRYIGQEEAKPKRLFKKHFPTVYKIFSAIKRHDKTILPRLLQRIESHLVLLVIAKRIAKERRKLPIFTIHDSIITTKGNEEYVRAIIADEMKKAIGIAPKLSTEHWHPQNLTFNDGAAFCKDQPVAA